MISHLHEIQSWVLFLFSSIRFSSLLYPLSLSYIFGFGPFAPDFPSSNPEHHPYNRVLYSPGGTASQCDRSSGLADLDQGQVGAAASRALQRPYRLLQAALRGERSLGLGVEHRNSQPDRIPPGRAEKVDRVQDVGGGRHERRRRPAQLPDNRANPRRRYVSPILRRTRVKRGKMR